MVAPALAEAAVRFEPPFHDVDLLAIVWHGHYYKYFELARTALYRKLNFDVAEMAASGYLYPVIESQCRHVAPLRYGQTAVASARLSEISSYIRIDYTIRDGESGARLAYGHTKQAVCRPDGTLLLAVPESVAAILGGA